MARYSPKSNGLSIDDYIRRDQRYGFYQNATPTRKYDIANGLPPYDFPTNGLVLYIPLWHRSLSGGSFESIDQYMHVCTVTGATWSPSGRTFGTDKLITVPDHVVFTPTTATGFTVAVRARSDTTGTLMGLVCKYGSTDYEWALRVAVTNQLDFFLYGDKLATTKKSIQHFFIFYIAKANRRS